MKNSWISGVLGWAVLLGSAAIAGDMAAACVDKAVLQEPDPIEASDVTDASSVSEDQLGDLDSVLREPAGSKSRSSSTEGEGSDGEDGGEDADVEGDSAGLDGAFLQGTILSGTLEGAFIEHEGEVKTVFVGGELAGHVLTEVYPTYVVFHKNGKAFRLYLETISEFEKGGEELADSGDEQPIVKEEKPKKSRLRLSKKNKDKQEKLSLDDIRAELDDSAKMAKQVRVVPEDKDGQPWGTRIEFRTPDNIMSKLGLMDNDVLLSVNGSPTRNADDMFQGYMTIRNSSTLEFVVDRNGQETTVRYELADNTKK